METACLLGPAASEPHSPPCADPPQPGSDIPLRILLEDDDPQVRAFTSRVLTWAGCHVTGVRSGREAVDAWPADGEPYDLVILDVVMPEMNGFEAYRELARHHPDARFLFVSAYAQELNLDAFLDEEQTSFIAKPFVPHFFVDKVRDAAGWPALQCAACNP